MKDKVRELLEQGIMPTSDNLAKLSDKSSVEVLETYNFEPHKIDITDFREAIRTNYSVMKNFLMNRSELQNTISIARASQSSEKTMSLIAMVYEISKLPTGTYRLELEDLSGKITAIVSKKNEELMEKASFIAHDEVLGFVGGFSKNTFFVNDIIWPDIPQKQISKTKEDVYIAFLADLHIGSKVFQKKEFEKFIDWINIKHADEKQRKIAEKVKYIFFAGDSVDGVGVYPQQNLELDVLDVYEQYAMFSKYVSKIPKDKQIIICSGNHDGVRLEDPKPKLPKNLAPALYEMKNVHLVANPSLLRLHHTSDYSGITVLMYHGDSFDYYINEIEPLRLSGGYDQGTEVLKYFLQRRSLSPTYGGQEVLPMRKNPMIIYQVPDVMLTGHIHKSDIGNYKGVCLICASCFQGRTSFQEKLGHHPDPGKVILLNLRNMKVTVLDFNE